MQNEVVDKKIRVLYDNYRDSLYAKNAQEEVEGLRRSAVQLGAGISTVAFLGNEAARLAMRSPLFKLKAHNVLFWLIAPTYFCKQAYEQDVQKRIENMWRVHRNRTDRGLGPTWSDSGHHESMKQDRNMLLPNATWSFAQIVDGVMTEQRFDNPFLRWHKSFGDYPAFLSDIDDHTLQETDTFERLKKFQPDPKKVVGTSTIIPKEDNDEKFEFYDVQGESLYTNPPNPNHITIDHGTDEDTIWAFGRTLFNQMRVDNTWASAASQNTKLSYAPFWGQKLSQPAFFKRDKIAKFNRHWNHRLGLEALKLQHAKQFGEDPSDRERQFMQDETSKFIDECYEHEKLQKFNDVYVTDHVAQDPKYVTGSEEEDVDFFEYQNSLDAYHAEGKKQPSTAPGSGRYEPGSLMQRIMDPLALSTRDANGSILHTVSQADMENFSPDLADDDKLKDQYEKAKARSEVWDFDEEDEEAFKQALMQELQEGEAGFNAEDFDKVLDKELGTFINQKYDYVKDLKDAYKSSLRTTAEQKIFATIPDHVFWDIKTPKEAGNIVRTNRYNPFRGREFANFFEMRDQEEYMDSQENKNNRNASVSHFRRY